MNFLNRNETIGISFHPKMSHLPATLDVSLNSTSG